MTVSRAHTESSPLPPLQQAYWIGRRPGITLGSVAIFTYYEFDVTSHDIDDLLTAWREVVDDHEMLRAGVSSDGKLIVHQTVPNPDVPVIDLRGISESRQNQQLASIRRNLSHQNRSGELWPLFDLRITRLDDRTRLHIGFDGLAADLRSKATIFSDWKVAFEGSRESPATTADLATIPTRGEFRDFVSEVASRASTSRFTQDREFWMSRLPDLPPAPDLPLRRAFDQLTVHRFTRTETELDAASWRSVKESARKHGLRPSEVIALAYSLALQSWSREPRFTLNLSVIDEIGRGQRYQSTVGCFGSNVLVAVDFRGGDTILNLARRLQSRIREDLAHSSFSGVEVLRELMAASGGRGPALMPVVLTCLVSADEKQGPEIPGSWLGEQVFSLSQTPQVTLDLQARQIDGKLVLRFDHREYLFPDGLISALAACVRDILQSIADDDKVWMVEWNDLRRSILGIEISTPALSSPSPSPSRSPSPSPSSKSPPSPSPAVSDSGSDSDSGQSALLHEPFQRHASLQPESVAIEGSWGEISYGDLNRRAGAVAAWLRKTGVEPDSLVGIVMHKGPEQIIAALGVLMAGAAYLPVDMDLPPKRRRFMLENGRVRRVLTEPEPGAGFDIGDMLVREISIGDPIESPGNEGAKSSKPGPDNLAYVIFTSGSTGRPKGVMIEHRAALNTIEDINRRFSVGPADRVLALSSLSFDLSVYDIFGTLAAGGSIVFPTASEARDPRRWLDLAIRYQATIWNSVPALLGLAVDDVEHRNAALPEALRLFMLSGDWIPVDLPDRIRARSHGAGIVSLGGATEASIWSILYPIEKVDPEWRSIPYGYPMDGQNWVVVGRDLEPRPDWAYGELCIAGKGLARGYWGDDEQTRQRFFRDPASGVRFYRTGDIGRRLPDGRFEIMGREDSQVKIRGFRVELGEVEAALRDHPAVSAVAVTANGSDRSQRRLVAHVVLAEHVDEPAEILRHYLGARLPEYMIPERIRILDRLPLAGTGKVDRAGLAEVNEAFDQDTIEFGPRKQRRPRQAPNETRAPNGNLALSGNLALTGNLVSNVIRAQIGVADLADDDNFLALGANSIDIIQIINRIEDETGVRLNLDAVFANPSASGLTDLVGSGAQNSMPEINDPIEREHFKELQPGIRRFSKEHRAHVFRPVAATGNDDLQARVRRRRSRRRFDQGPVSLSQIEALLAPLQQVDEARRLYASAGGLYPVQVYLYAKPGRCEGLENAWYLDPIGPRLVKLHESFLLPEESFDRLINRPIFKSSAFAIFLVMDRGAIEPLYGDRSKDYALVEAGSMCQILETTAPIHGLGMCQIGEFETPNISRLLQLESDQVPIHCLLGGGILAQDPANEVLALTPSQQAVASRSVNGLSAARDNVPVLAWLEGQPDISLFQKALDRLVESEPALRARLRAIQGSPAQIILDDEHVTIEHIDLARQTEPDPEDQAMKRAREFASDPFDLSRGPLLRVALLTTGATRSLLVFVFNAFIADCFSVRIAVRRFGEIVTSIVKDEPDVTPVRQAEYSGLVAAWSRRISSDRTREGLLFLNERLAGVPHLGKEPPDQHSAAESATEPPTRPQGRLEFTISTEDLRELRKAALVEGATLFMGLIAALANCVSEYSGQTDVLLGTVASVRLVAGGDEVVGPFSNPVAIRMSCAGNRKPSECLRRARDATISAFTHQAVPRALVEESMGTLESGATPIQVSTVFHHTSETGGLSLPGLTVSQARIARKRLGYPLEISLSENGGAGGGEHVDVNGDVNGDVDGDVDVDGDGLHGELHFLRGGWEEELAHAILHGLAQEVRRLTRDIPPSPDPVSSDPAFKAKSDEKQLSALVQDVWEEVLNRSVDLDTLFFDAGGESMAALTVVNELEERLGVVIPLSLMFENPSVRSLAGNILARVDVRRQGSLVRLRDGKGAPILIVPGRIPSPFMFVPFARQLPGNRPVYFAGLSSLRSFVPGRPRVEDLSADLLADLRMLPSWESTDLIGYSFGGIIACDLLRRMPRRDQSKCSLVMVDTDTPSSLRYRLNHFDVRRFVRHPRSTIRRWLRRLKPELDLTMSPRALQNPSSQTFAGLEAPMMRMHLGYQLSDLPTRAVLVLAADDRFSRILKKKWSEIAGDELRFDTHSGTKATALRDQGPEVVAIVDQTFGLTSSTSDLCYLPSALESAL